MRDGQGAPDLVEHHVRVPLVVPYRGVSHRDITLVGGPEGWGECSPLPGYPCDPASARRAAVEAATVAWPTPVRTRVRVNALVAGSAPADAVAAAEAAVEQGFDTLKLKLAPASSLARSRVVRGDFPAVSEIVHSVETVRAVRAAVGPRVALRVDCNAALTVESATSLLEALEGSDLEYVEQPVGSIEDLARLKARVRVPLAADECVRSVADAQRLRELGAADVLVVKVQPLGGLATAREIVAAAGLPVVVSSMIESSVGLAVGLALAGSLPDPPLACGLATARMLALDVVADPLVPEGGWLPVRRVELDPQVLSLLAQ